LASLKYIRINNGADTNSAQSGNLTENTDQVRIGAHATGGDQPFDGVIDEVRISSTARSDAWLNTEYNNQSDPATFFTLGPEAPATAVKLLSFDATGKGSDVQVSWQTAHEIHNMGFYVYRAEAKEGPFKLLNEELIPGSMFNTMGQHYQYSSFTTTAWWTWTPPAPGPRTVPSAWTGTPTACPMTGRSNTGWTRAWTTPCTMPTVTA
jgi:hypothetical protein